MFFYALKTIITLILIIAAAEIAKRSSVVGGLVASIPIVPVMAMVWLYVDTQDAAKVAMLARNIFWLVLPSLSLFISLPALLSLGANFWLSLGASLVVMIVCYAIMLFVLGYTGYGSVDH